MRGEVKGVMELPETTIEEAVQAEKEYDSASRRLLRHYRVWSPHLLASVQAKIRGAAAISAEGFGRLDYAERLAVLILREIELGLERQGRLRGE